MPMPMLRPMFSALVVAGCMAPALASAMLIDKTVNVNVYQVCQDDGFTCASKGPAGNEYYVNETNKIWAQAGISVTFSFIDTIANSAFYNLDDTIEGRAFDDLYNFKFGAGAASKVTNRVDMFLVNNFDGAYGVGYFGFGGLVMSMKTISEFDCGGAAGCTGRVDTLAHELGHNFGLVPSTFLDADNVSGDDGHSLGDNTLMRSGLSRLVPTTAADIAPDNLGLDLLPQTHIDLARRSTLLNAVPEPSTWAMVALALLGLGATTRRRQS